MLKNLLPDTIAVRALALLLIGLAITHLVSNLFYATDRENALLTAGGSGAIQWVATVGAFTDTVPPDEWANLVEASNSDARFVTITADSVVAPSARPGWREGVLQRELGRHVQADRLNDYRIAYAPVRSESAALSYWRGYLTQAGLKTPGELILVSLRLNNGTWLNMATPIQSSPGFFSARLGLSMAVMLIAVLLISLIIVRRMTGPLKQLSRAAEKLGTDVQAPAIPETGPEEVRRTAHAFNVMQNRIRRFVQDRTQMLGAVAHDLGTPITRLRLRAEFVEDPKLRTKILRDLDDMQHMVASTLSFIREDATSEPQATVDLGSLLSRVCDDIKDAGENVELLDIERWTLVDCRPVALRRALFNLIENAVKYGRSARVSVKLEAQRILIRIDDDGPGIPAEHREDVFQPFRRLESSRNRETGGTGLGLAVARTIVRAHGGDITITNRSEGGLRVILRLPRPTQLHEHSGAASLRGDAPAKSDTKPARQSNTKVADQVWNPWNSAGGDLAPALAGARSHIQSRLETSLPEGGTREWKTH
ncbi:MAG: HAMP domain-containing protein [Alphaproteobacteria bacterium]|nr:HAMP domain-containing protein [Alphaproteobacteria bacterium]